MYYETPSGLMAPKSFLEASPKEKAKRCNGCGPKGWKADLVPDNIYGLSISEACDIHDWMYSERKSAIDRWEADLVFLSNMLRKINQGSVWMRWLRRRRVYKYYDAVRIWGGEYINEKVTNV